MIKKSFVQSHFVYCLSIVIMLLCCIYLIEFVLGFYFVRSLLYFPVPPYAKQWHRTKEYDVEYVYNNISMRGADFSKEKKYDVLLVGDSFFWA